MIGRSRAPRVAGSENRIGQFAQAEPGQEATESRALAAKLRGRSGAPLYNESQNVAPLVEAIRQPRLKVARLVPQLIELVLRVRLQLIGAVRLVGRPCGRLRLKNSFIWSRHI